MEKIIESIAYGNSTIYIALLRYNDFDFCIATLKEQPSFASKSFS